jgi:MFS family permease
MSEYKWNVLWIAAIGSFMGSLDGTIVNIAIPTISVELNVSFDIIQWVTIIYLLMNAISLVAFGKLADIRGRKQYFLVGLILFTSSSLLCGISQSSFMLITFRAVQGIGASMVSANAPAMITEAFPPEER